MSDDDQFEPFGDFSGAPVGFDDGDGYEGDEALRFDEDTWVWAVPLPVIASEDLYYIPVITA